MTEQQIIHGYSDHDGIQFKYDTYSPSVRHQSSIHSPETLGEL